MAGRPDPTPLAPLVAAFRSVPGRVRRVFALLIVVALAVPAATSADRVSVSVDGRMLQVRTHAVNVGDVLEDAGVEVGANDLVVPAMRATVRDGLDIEVVRAVTVAIDIDGRKVTLPVAGDTVQDALIAAGIDDTVGLSIVPPPDAPLEDDLEVTIIEPRTVIIEVDGQREQVRMRTGTVADALALARVQVRDNDTVSVPVDTDVDGDLTVRVTRRDREVVVEEVVLPYHEQYVETADRFVGEWVEVREGAEGLRRDRYRITLVDGVETDRTLLDQTVVTEPRDRIVEIGTQPVPEPEPEPEPEPAPEPEPVPEPDDGLPTDPNDDATWDRLAQCESHGNWAAQGTYHGGLQFHPDTWTRWKLSEHPTYAYEATRLEQIAVGRRLHAARGWSPWPTCARELGLM